MLAKWTAVSGRVCVLNQDPEEVPDVDARDSQELLQVSFDLKKKTAFHERRQS
ncbi:MAG: hypothetical protein JWM11_6009 [Planctomycetaceae bacterium]|nr:hypothetical protein [Planctomycetaceae bacterium]